MRAIKGWQQSAGFLFVNCALTRQIPPRDYAAVERVITDAATAPGRVTDGDVEEGFRLWDAGERGSE